MRTHLIEFVLREDDYREEMMRTIAPPLWVGPALPAGEDCHEPMQFGRVKALGHSEALGAAALLRPAGALDDEGDAVQSLHSRVGGHYHGITAACETAHRAW